MDVSPAAADIVSNARPGKATANPLISAVIAVRDDAAGLEVTLDDLRRWQSPELEVVVIDGGSTDGSQSVVARRASQIAYWESEPDRGIYHAWNKALKHVRGEWVWFVGAGDGIPATTSFRDLSDQLRELPSDQLVAYGTAEILGDGPEAVYALGDAWPEVRGQLRTTLPFAHGAAFHRKLLFERYGSFDERYRIAGDYELLLRVLPSREPAFIGAAVIRVAPGGVSNSPGLDGRRVRERHWARQKHGLTRLPEWASPTIIRVSTRSWIARRWGPVAVTRARQIYRRLLRRPNRSA